MPLLAGVLAGRADAGVVYGICGSSVCTVDDRTGKKRTLLRGGGTYTAVSASRSGSRVAYVRGRDLYVVATRGGRAERLARGVTGPSWALR